VVSTESAAQILAVSLLNSWRLRFTVNKTHTDAKSKRNLTSWRPLCDKFSRPTCWRVLLSPVCSNLIMCRFIYGKVFQLMLRQVSNLRHTGRFGGGGGGEYAAHSGGTRSVGTCSKHLHALFQRHTSVWLLPVTHGDAIMWMNMYSHRIPNHFGTSYWLVFGLRTDGTADVQVTQRGAERSVRSIGK
jgi:hypothetical protein